MNLSTEDRRRRSRGTCRPSDMPPLLLLLFAAALTTGAAGNGAKFVKKLHAPSVVDPRSETLQLRCEYDLQGNELYSVSWYKGDKMLLMYQPSKKSEDNVHDKTVSLEHSNAEVLTIHGNRDDVHANIESYQGTYVCEVTMEKSFIADYAMANVSVAILPQKNPVLDGVQNNYQIGERLEAICASAPSLPPAELAFYLNNQKVSKVERGQQQKIGDAVVSQISLHVQLQRHHFVGGSLNLTCSATLPGVVVERAYRTVKMATLAASNQPLAQEPPRMSSTSAAANLLVPVSWLALLAMSVLS